METTTPGYLPQIPMPRGVHDDHITLYYDDQKPGNARHQFESAVAAIVERAVREAVAKDRMERFAATMTAAKPTSTGELATCPACMGLGGIHVSMPHGCRSHQCPRCAGSGVEAAREPEGAAQPESTPVAHDEAAPAPEPALAPRERLYRAFAGRATDADYDTAAQMLMASFKNADIATLTFVCGCLAGERTGERGGYL